MRLLPAVGYSNFMQLHEIILNSFNILEKVENKPQNVVCFYFLANIKSKFGDSSRSFQKKHPPTLINTSKTLELINYSR